MNLPTTLKVFIIGLISFFSLFFLINYFPIFYFDSIQYRAADYTIEYHYKWDLTGGQDIFIDRAIKIRDDVGRKVSFKLSISPQGPTEVKVYHIDQSFTYKGKVVKEALYLDGPWVMAVIDMDDMELLEMGSLESSATEPIDSSLSKNCIGKFYYSQFVEGNCEIEFR